MKIVIERKYKKPNYTIGSLTIISKKSLPSGGDIEEASFFCNTLEPRVGTDAEAVTAGSGKAILPGLYHLKFVFSPKFQKKLPLLEDVKGRSGILIHAGNAPRDTRGCILVGKNLNVGKLLQSKDCLNALINKINKSIGKGEEVTVKIK